MTHQFYDVMKKEKVEAEVTSKVTYTRTNEKTGKSRTSYAFKGQTADGRPLTGFVSQATYDQATDVPVE